MNQKPIKAGQTYHSMYLDGTVADTFYVNSIKSEIAHLCSTNTGKEVKVGLSKMNLDMQHGQLQLKQ
ncbi:hypothetical protein [Saccharicrinis aurantiacus]|uniref:hypothetical protein n=1 Tax=Saccharicrinis aurantiacus TaxID=1849719 RepID=UPI00094F7A5E|nr:hypothetical protein [Saccharicrinis aurantiacus]